MPSPTHSPRHPTRIVARQRQAAALAGRVHGHTFQAIGDEIGVSAQRAHQLVSAALAEITTEVAERADELRSIEVARLDVAAAVLWPEVLAGNLRAHDRWLRNRESYRKLVGIDARDTARAGDTNVLNIVMPDWARPPAHAGVIEGQVAELPAP